jgi:hypothetical protein
MHPTTALFLANDHIAELNRQADRERMARAARPNRRPGQAFSRLLGELARRQRRSSEEFAC